MSQEYKLVPVDATADMIAAGMKVYGATAPYSAMLAAAPAPLGMEVEVLAWYLPDEDGKPDATVRWDVAKHVPEAFPLVDHAHIARLQAENAALQQRLSVADQRVDDLEKDKQRLDALETNFWDVRHHSSPLADTGDYTGGVEIVGRWMDKPHERVIGEDYNESLRTAIDQAMTADAYPPARPEYPEVDAALSEENWHMNPCKQGHGDVGACGGKAFCHTCDEMITATSTQEAFEQWNSTHAPAVKRDEPFCLLCLDEKTVPGPNAGDFVRDCPDCAARKVEPWTTNPNCCRARIAVGRPR